MYPKKVLILAQMHGNHNPILTATNLIRHIKSHSDVNVISGIEFVEDVSPEEALVFSSLLRDYFSYPPAKRSSKTGDGARQAIPPELITIKERLKNNTHLDTMYQRLCAGLRGIGVPETRIPTKESFFNDNTIGEMDDEAGSPKYSSISQLIQVLPFTAAITDLYRHTKENEIKMLLLESKDISREISSKSFSHPGFTQTPEVEQKRTNHMIGVIQKSLEEEAHDNSIVILANIGVAHAKRLEAKLEAKGIKAQHFALTSSIEESAFASDIIDTYSRDMGDPKNISDQIAKIATNLINFGKRDDQRKFTDQINESLAEFDITPISLESLISHVTSYDASRPTEEEMEEFATPYPNASMTANAASSKKLDSSRSSDSIGRGGGGGGSL
jgi:hypothetical protein